MRSKLFHPFGARKKGSGYQISWPWAALATWVASRGPWHAVWIWASHPAASTHDTSLCADVPWPQKRCIGGWWVVSNGFQSHKIRRLCATLRLKTGSSTPASLGPLCRSTEALLSLLRRPPLVSKGHCSSQSGTACYKETAYHLHIIQSAWITGHCNQLQGSYSI